MIIDKFSWKNDTPSDEYSDIYNNFLKKQHSTMTEEECRNLCNITYYYSSDLNYLIASFKKARKSFANEQEAMDAYPYEIFFRHAVDGD